MRALARCARRASASITMPATGDSTPSRSRAPSADRAIRLRARRTADAAPDGVDPIRDGRGVADAGPHRGRSRASAAITWRATRPTPRAVGLLRARKFRKEQPFALMARDLDVAQRARAPRPSRRSRCSSRSRVPSSWRRPCAPLVDVAPDNRELGVMLPYAPLHHLLFARGRAAAARHDQRQSFGRAAGVPGRRRLRAARRASPMRSSSASVPSHAAWTTRWSESVRSARRSCGAPGATRRARWRRCRSIGPVLALGADLKNSVTLVVDGQAFMSQYIGDLEDARTRRVVRRRRSAI